jgi:hypothetical protein
MDTMSLALTHTSRAPMRLKGSETLLPCLLIDVILDLVTGMHHTHVVQDGRCIDGLHKKPMVYSWHTIQEETEAALPHSKDLLDKKACG